MPVPERIVAAALSRVRLATPAIETTVACVSEGRPLDAEPDQQRKVDRIAAVTGVDAGTASRLAAHQSPAALGLAGESLARAEAIQGETVDYLGVAWLDAGRLASQAVARLVLADGTPYGTGFLVSDRLLLTNNHVIASPEAARGMRAEFRYEIPLGARTAAPVVFSLDPGTFFETNRQDDLDFTLVAVGAPVTPGGTLSAFGQCPLSDSAAKHTLGELVNVIEHPDGDYKQVVVRENRIVHRGDTVLHYLADTEPGSSGSPVFNDQWHVVALHHWGAPHRETTDGGRPLSRSVNEGIRVSSIVADLKQRADGLSPAGRDLLAAALSAPPPGDFGSRRVGPSSNAGPQAILPPVQTSRTNPQEPPMMPTPVSSEAAGYPANRIDRTYSNRRGYNPRFLPGFEVPLPQLRVADQARAARVRGVGAADHPFELEYEHYSVVLRADRRMPFFSACNVDGARHYRIDRDTGVIKSGPEATEVWATDPRVPEEAQLDDAFYTRLRRALNVGDFFARGHMTRREDPNWGTADSAVKANYDTYHHPNACPQLQNAFNNSQKVWRAIENFTLGGADDNDIRATIITGPVFDDENDMVFDDTEFGPVKLPSQFWKVVAYVEDGTLKAFAIVADQREAMDRLQEASNRPEAAFDWPAKLNRHFRTTIRHIEELTGLDFGDLVSHDLYSGEPEALTGAAESIVPRRPAPGSFGRFESMGDFLDAWETAQRPAPVAAEEEAGAERRRRRDRSGPQPPAARGRKVAEVEAVVARVFADDLSGARHQQFSVTLTRAITVDPRAKADVDATLTSHAEVRLAVRFGDSRGLPDRIPGIRTGVALHIKGEWIPSPEAFAVGGERLAVLHFTHDPLGYICTPAECFS